MLKLSALHKTFFVQYVAPSHQLWVSKKKKKINYFFFNILAKKNTFNFLFSSTEEMALQEPI